MRKSVLLKPIKSINHHFSCVRGIRGRPRVIDNENYGSSENRPDSTRQTSDRHQKNANLNKFGEFSDPNRSILGKNRNEASKFFKDSATFIDLESPAVVADHWTSGLYPKNVRNQRDITKFSFRPPNLDPKETSVILFPGQGSQYVGMAKKLIDFPKTRELFDWASSILRYDLLKLCLEGPKQELDKTIHCQPAVFVCSLAALERLKIEKPKAVENCIATAGFSVGEYAALVLANVLSFEDALKLLKIRAQAMQDASEMRPSGLLTVYQNYASQLELAMEGARQWVKHSSGETAEPVCSVANYLFTNCKVVGGQEEALEFIEFNAEKFKIRCKRLPVSGAFHTALMKPAAEILRDEMKKFKFADPLIYVHSNLDGKAYRNGEEIQRKLSRQVYLAVRWEQTMHALYDRDFFAKSFPTTYECGPGKQLGVMLKYCNARAHGCYRNVFDEEIE